MGLIHSPSLLHLPRRALRYEFGSVFPSGANSSSYTASSMSCGSLPNAGENRHLLVIVSTAETVNAALTGLTFNGVSILGSNIYYASSGGAGSLTSIYVYCFLDLSTTTANVVATLAGTASRFGVAIVSLYGLESPVPLSEQIAPFSTSGTSACETSFTASYPGILFSVVSARVGSNRTFTWSNGTTNELWDAAMESGTHNWTGAIGFTTAVGTITATATPSGTTQTSDMVSFVLR